MKRVLSLLLALCLMVTLMASCQSSDGDVATDGADTATSDAGDTTADSTSVLNEEGYPIVNQPVTLSIVYSADARGLPAEEMIFEQKWNGITGVTVEYTALPADAAVEKVNLMLTSKSDLPDVFMGVINRNDIMKYMDEDIFIPVTDLVEDHMPLLSSVFEQRPDYKAQATAPDGNLWGFPYIEEMNGLILNQGTFHINTKWLDALGLDMPTTLEEYRDVLEAFRDDDPNGNGLNDEIPLTTNGKDGNSGLGAWRNNSDIRKLSALFGQVDYGDSLGLDADNNIFCTATTDAFKDFTIYFNEMYQDGLIDPEIFNNDRSMLSAKLRNETPIVGSFIVWAIEDNVDAERREDYAVIPSLSGPGGEYGNRENLSEMHNPVVFSITTECEYPEVAARYADGLYDPQTSVEANWGALDYQYVLNDDGVMVFNELQEGLDTYDDMRARHTLAGRHPCAVLNDYYDTVVEYPTNAMDIYSDMVTTGFVADHLDDPYIPPLWYTVEEVDRLSILSTDIYRIIDTYYRSFIIDGDVEAQWDTYVSELEASGLEEFISIVQGGYDINQANAG